MDVIRTQVVAGFTVNVIITQVVASLVVDKKHFTQILEILLEQILAIAVDRKNKVIANMDVL